MLAQTIAQTTMTPKLQRLHNALQTALGGRIVSLKEALGELTLEVKASDYRAVAETLPDSAELGFDELTDLCGMDYSTYGDRPASDEMRGPRYAAVVHLLSITHKWRVRVRTFCADDDFPLLAARQDVLRRIAVPVVQDHLPALPLRPDHAAGLEDLHPGDARLAGGGRRLDANPVLALKMRPGHATHA